MCVWGGVKRVILVHSPWLKACQVPSVALEALISRDSSVLRVVRAEVPKAQKAVQSATEWHNWLALGTLSLLTAPL